MINEENNLVKFDDFVAQTANAKTPIQSIIKFLVREVNKQKLNYHQLKYIFRIVRSRCEIDAGNKPKKLFELPTDDELDKFFASVRNPVHRLMFDVLLGTGLRVGELCNLEVKRIDFRGNQLFVSEGKGKKDRIVIFGNKLRDKLELYLQGKHNRFLFESSRHAKFTTRRIEQLCKKYKKLSALEKNLTPHTLRHIWNTKLAVLGLDKEKRALLAGHSNQHTQDIYTHLSVGGFKSDIVKLLDE